MDDIRAIFSLEENDLTANFSLTDEDNLDAVFKIDAAGTTWGSIDGNIANQTDLKTELNSLSDQIAGNHSEITNIELTMQGYGDIVTHNTTEFATATEGTLASTALQPGDNITKLTNNAGYITGINSLDVISALGYTPQRPLTPGYGISLNNNTISTSTTIASKTDIGNADLIIKRNNTSLGTFSANATSPTTINISVPTTATEVGALPSDTTINDLTTTTQQAAINSGANTVNIGQISTNTSAIAANTSAIAANTSAISHKQDTLIPGANIQINNNTISATATQYTLPVATTAILGGIKVGNNLSISADGTLDSLMASYYEGDGIDITNNTISVSSTIASKTDIHDGKTIFKKNGAAFATITANQTSTVNVDYTIPTTASDVGALPDSTIIGDANTTILVNSTSVGTINANQTTAGSVNISVPTDTTDLTNGAGYITGISSSDVTTALGYTPYDSSNPNGYTSNVGTVTSVNNVQPVNGNVTISIPDISNLADVDLSNLSSTGKKVIDGQWVALALTLASGVTYPTATDTEYSLSTYLPNDGYNYEVLINGTVTTGSSSGNAMALRLQTDILNDGYFIMCNVITRTNAQAYNSTAIVAPVGTGRKIIVKSSSYTGTYSIYLRGYRRIGTNS